MGVGGFSIWEALSGLAVLAFFFLPLLFVLFSSRVSGGAKFGWALLVFFFNWLAFAVFLIVNHGKRSDTPHQSA